MTVRHLGRGLGHTSRVSQAAAEEGGGGGEPGVIADFTTGTYTLNGEEVALEAILGTNEDWGTQPFPDTNLGAMTATSFEQGIITAEAVMTEAAAAGFQEGFVAVLSAQLGVANFGTSSASIGVGMGDIPDFIGGWFMSVDAFDGTGLAHTDLVVFDNDEAFDVFDYGAPDGVPFKIAMRFAADGIAVSRNGGANNTTAPIMALAEATQFIGFSLNANSDGANSFAVAGISRLEVYPLSTYDASDLPTLSAL